MHIHPAASERRRLSLVIILAGYAAAWVVVVPVLANLAQTGVVARHHLEAHPTYHLRYPPTHENRRLPSTPPCPWQDGPATAATTNWLPV
ncbi:hypothetical protein [Duganella sp.]|uniref:hypothetical protein n=1 Tax=Duganella sp. TaxID=1904440 RepID=UPI0031DD55B6